MQRTQKATSLYTPDETIHQVDIEWTETSIQITYDEGYGKVVWIGEREKCGSLERWRLESENDWAILTSFHDKRFVGRYYEEGNTGFWQIDLQQPLQ